MKNTYHFFNASLVPEELEQILQNIEANISARSAVHPSAIPRYTLPVPAPVPDFAAAIAALRTAQAPYYVADGSLPARVVKKILNLFIKIFGRKQAYYNTLNLDMLGAFAAHMNTLQLQNNSQVNVINDLVQTVAQLENTLEELHTAQIPGQKINSKNTAQRKKTVQRKP